MGIRTTQVAVDALVLESTTANARVTNTSVDVLAKESVTVNARVSSVCLDVLVSPDPPASEGGGQARNMTLLGVG